MSEQMSNRRLYARMVMSFAGLAGVIAVYVLIWARNHPTSTSSAMAQAQPDFNCNVPQVWKSGDDMSDGRKAAVERVLRTISGEYEIAGRLCEVHSKTDAQLEQEVRDAAVAAEKRRLQVLEAKRIQAEKEAADRAAVERENAEVERRAAEQAARDPAQVARQHAQEVRDGIKNGTIKFISAEDLSVQTHKWDGRQIVTRMNCFYADVNEFRCVGGRSRIDFESFEPYDAEESIKDNCDTLSKSQRHSCSVKILFTYNGFGEMDIGSGLFGGHMTVIKPMSRTGEIIGK